MEKSRILVTGGAGFVGSHAAMQLAARHPQAEVVAFDNLARRGSELNLPRLRDAGVRFVHGDVRSAADLMALDPISQLVECSAEPSVMAGVTSSPDYLVQTNLLGAYHCLELARRDDAHVTFLSTSRVYPVGQLEALALVEDGDRFSLAPEQPLSGVSERGIGEDFPLTGARTLYGTTKLAAEHLVEEYRHTYGLKAAVLRFGVIAGPWQFGKVDQGVFTFWMLGHTLGRPLRYIGYGGTGLQVRDLLHVDDAVDLIDRVLSDPDGLDGLVANAGGGVEGSLSLRETTALCEEITGRSGLVEPSTEERQGDVPYYVSDASRAREVVGWRPQVGPREILAAIHDWIIDNEAAVRAAL